MYQERKCDRNVKKSDFWKEGGILDRREKVTNYKQIEERKEEL